jgi:hypothetical protein
LPRVDQGGPLPKAFALIAATALLTAGCSGAAAELEVLSTGVGVEEGHAEAELAGSLSGTVADGLACFLVTTGDGQEFLVSWPEGYAALDAPLRLLDETGEVVATEGDDVVLVGGTALEDETPIECGGLEAPEWRSGGVTSSG